MASRQDRTVNPDGVDTEEIEGGDTGSRPNTGGDTTWTGQDDDESRTKPHAKDRLKETGENDDGQDRRPDDEEISLDEPAMSPGTKPSGS